MCNQYGMFYSFYWYYELKIIHVSVKRAYLGIYFIEKRTKRRLNSIVEIAIFQLFFQL